MSDKTAPRRSAERLGDLAKRTQIRTWMPNVRAGEAERIIRRALESVAREAAERLESGAAKIRERIAELEEDRGLEDWSKPGVFSSGEISGLRFALRAFGFPEDE